MQSSKAKRIAVFVYDGEESSTLLWQLGTALRSIGHEVIGIDYWLTPTSEPSGTGTAWDARISLSDQGIHSIYRPSRAEYLRLCGDDIDFPACMQHVFLEHGMYEGRDFLYMDSAFYREHYGFAYRAEQLLRALRPEVAIIQQGSRPVPAIIAAKCCQLAIPFLILEGPFFAGHFLLDAHGMHFFPGLSRIDRFWPQKANQPLTEAQQVRIREFVARWKGDRASKYEQHTSSEELERLNQFLQPGERLVVLPDQIPGDASVVTGLGRFGSQREFLEFWVNKITPGWKLVIKAHPKSKEPEALNSLARDNVMIARQLSIHDLFVRASIVTTMSSNVGFEALLYGKPVVTGGAPHYARRGFTIDLRTTMLTGFDLSAAAAFQPPEELFERYAHHIIFEYLIREADLDALDRRIAEADATTWSPESRRAPFASAYPRFARKFLDLIDRYQHFALLGLPHEECLVRASPAGAVHRGSLSGPGATLASSG